MSGAGKEGTQGFSMVGWGPSADAPRVSPHLSRVFSDYLRLARNPQFATSAGIVALTAAAASVYAFGLSMSLAVVLGCFLLSSAIYGVQSWRERPSS
jgi:hypothetical protein